MIGVFIRATVELDHGELEKVTGRALTDATQHLHTYTYTYIYIYIPGLPVRALDDMRHIYIWLDKAQSVTPL